MKLNINKDRIGVGIINAEMKGLRALSKARNLYLLLAGAIILSACAGGLIDATSIPQIDTIIPDPTATPLPHFGDGHSLILNSNPTCLITGAEVGAPDFPSAIPEGGALNLICNGVQENAQLTYSNEIFDTTGYVMYQSPDQLPMMGQIGNQLHEIPDQINIDPCEFRAFPFPGNGTSEFTQDGVIQSGDMVAPIVDTGTNTGIYETQGNEPVPSFNILPQYPMGSPAGSELTRFGYHAWAVFRQSLTEAGSKLLSYVGIARGNDCNVLLPNPVQP